VDFHRLLTVIAVLGNCSKSVRQGAVFVGAGSGYILIILRVFVGRDPGAHRLSPDGLTLADGQGITHLSQRCSPDLRPQGLGTSWQKYPNGAGTQRCTAGVQRRWQPSTASQGPCRALAAYRGTHRSAAGETVRRWRTASWRVSGL